MPFFNKKFDAESLPSFNGKVVIVTGGNTGIGRETVSVLSSKGATVYLACRDIEKGKQAIQQLDANVNIKVLKLDLTNLSSVKAAAEEFLSKESRLDILINNAGVMLCPYTDTATGIELQMQTNHVGHFYLTKLLIPTLLNTPSSRIITVSSNAHYFFPWNIDFKNINIPQSWSWTRYAQSKLANVLHSRKLHTLYHDKILCIALDPGAIDSDLQRHVDEYWWYRPFSAFIRKTSLITVKDGALTTLYACSTEAKQLGGQYLVPYGKTQSPSWPAQRTELADKLWEWTEKLLKEKGF